ncbi:MAG: hypothetical protein LBS74_01910 [Oscillospiraceae bacterium]|jgi:hypothetical protein|nr:hypothetical protein [Oscillospiraceae bacterium]
MTKKQSIFRKITAIIFAMAVAASLFTLVVSATSYTSTLYIGSPDGYVKGATRSYAAGKHEVDLRVDKINQLITGNETYTMTTKLQKPAPSAGGSPTTMGTHGPYTYKDLKTYYLPVKKESIAASSYYYEFTGSTYGSLSSGYTIMHTY